MSSGNPGSQENDRSSKRVFLQASLWAFFYFFVLDSPGLNTPWKKAAAEDKAAEEQAAQRRNKKIPPVSENAAKDKTENPGEVKTETEDEEDVQVPAEMPEDALFIPLGFAHKKPKTFYKGTDPEWQSFVDFSKDRKRTRFIKSANS